MSEKESPSHAVLVGGKKATKKAAKAKAKNGGAGDYIEQQVKEIEALDQESALQMAKDLLSVEGENDFRLGGVLAVIFENKWYLVEGESKTGKWAEYIEREFGFTRRKADYLKAMYLAIVEAGITEKDVIAVGWSKLRRIATYLDADNAKTIIAAIKKMSEAEVVEYAKTLKEKGADLATSKSAADESQPISTMSFRVHDDQKETIVAAIEKAKEVGETEHKAVALEYICLDFLAGGKKKSTKTKVVTKTLRELMEEAGYEKVLEEFGSVWPEIDITVGIEEEEES